MAWNGRNPAVKRILQELREAQASDNPDVAAEAIEDDIFEWHFAIRGAWGTPFAGGIYHGRILLPADFPFRPPSFVMLTPSGRFEVNAKICLSISSHHPESWQPSWNVLSALIALIAFMPTPAEGAVGSLEAPDDVRRSLAAAARRAAPRVGDATRQEVVDRLHAKLLQLEEASKRAAGIAQTEDAEGGETRAGEEKREGGETRAGEEKREGGEPRAGEDKGEGGELRAGVDKGEGGELRAGVDKGEGGELRAGVDKGEGGESRAERESFEALEAPHVSKAPVPPPAGSGRAAAPVAERAAAPLPPSPAPEAEGRGSEGSGDAGSGVASLADPLTSTASPPLSSSVPPTEFERDRTAATAAETASPAPPAAGASPPASPLPPRKEARGAGAGSGRAGTEALSPPPSRAFSSASPEIAALSPPLSRAAAPSGSPGSHAGVPAPDRPPVMAEGAVGGARDDSPATAVAPAADPNESTSALAEEAPPWDAPPRDAPPRDAPPRDAPPRDALPRHAPLQPPPSSALSGSPSWEDRSLGFLALAMAALLVAILLRRAFSEPERIDPNYAFRRIPDFRL